VTAQTIEEVRADFDELADLVEPGASGVDRFDPYLLSLVPPHTRGLLDVGCGLGRLTRAAARGGRDVIGVDLSPRMIQRARLESAGAAVTFVEGDFLGIDFSRRFDCIVSAAAMHHMPGDAALRRMVQLLAPGGRLVVHDLRRDASVGDLMRSHSALAGALLARLYRTGRLLQPRRVRRVWDRHGARERYLSLAEARQLADRETPGAAIHYHWLWRYTLVWDKPAAEH